MKATIRCILFLLSVAWTFAPVLADWSHRPVTIVSPFSAGGTSDVLARVMAEELQKRLGQSVIVENRIGAGGVIGATFVARAQPDGYTFLLASSGTHTILPLIQKSLPFDPVRDFAPVILVAEIPNLLIVNPALPVKTVDELIAHAKRSERALTYASSGVGTAQHMSGELFAARAGVRLVHVPYKGAGDVLKAVISGETDLSFNNFAVSLAISRGPEARVRAIAVTGRERSPVAPEIPTVAETLGGFETQAWFGLLGPTGVEDAVLARLAEALKAALTDPAIQARFSGEGAVARPLAREAFAGFLAEELAKWRQVVEEAGIKAE